MAEAGIPVTEDVNKMLHLGAAAMANKQRQRQSSNVGFDDSLDDNA